MPSGKKSESGTVAFLVSEPSAGAPSHNDNHQRLPALLSAHGWQVVVREHASLHVQQGELLLGEDNVQDYNLIWPIGFGPQALSLDLFQLLQLAPQARLQTHAAAYLNLHGKAVWQSLAPPTAVGHTADQLHTIMTQYPAPWVLKPNAGSLGRDVHTVHSRDEIEAIISKRRPQYWLLQPYLNAVQTGEYRTLVFDDVVLGTYKRLPGPAGLANLNQDGTAEVAQLPAADQPVLQAAMNVLGEHGVGFAAVDTVDGQLMEVNLANPGGLATLQQLMTDAAYTTLTDKLVAAINARHHPMSAG